MSTTDFEIIAERFELPIEIVIQIYNSLKPTFQTSQVSELITQVDSVTDIKFGEADIGFNQSSEQRYMEIGVLGIGGMGAVYRVKDKLLKRVVALKTMQQEHQSNPKLMQSFVQEACLTAQLQHPHIVPVHDMGMRPDGSLFFTMREVAGHNLEILIRDLHGAAKDGAWRSFGKDWSFRRVIDAFRRAVEAVAYAHSREVIHRDLKPANIMLGAHGEVYVVDWGLAVHLPSVESGTSDSSSGGTPMYMSPEQFQSKPEAFQPTSDVWSLGCMLFEILLGVPPFKNAKLKQLTTLSSTEINPEFSGEIRSRLLVNTVGAPKAPQELIDLVVNMLEPNIGMRMQSAEDVLKAITDWLDGARRSEAAHAIIAQAEDIEMAAQMAADQAKDIREQIKSLEKSIPAWAEDKEKQEIWDLQALVDNLEAQSLQKSLQMEELLHGALTHDPNNPIAHLLLSQRYRKAHSKSELEKDHIQSVYYASRLQYHAERLPLQHPSRKNILTYLSGLGKISLDFSPHQVTLDLDQAFPESRNQENANVMSFAQSTLKNHEMEMGSYVMKARAPKCHPLIYPIYIDRQRHWKSNPPNQPTEPVRLLRNSELDTENEVYVPAGWFLYGGDPLAIDALPQEQTWLDGFIIQKRPVSLRQYMQFLNSLLDENRDREAESYLPALSSQRRHFSIVNRGKGRMFRIYPDAEGDIWDMRWPVFYVDYGCIEAYVQWLKKTTNTAWRLPTAEEWEKAARGVDGRYYPWGDHFDNSWTCIRDSHQQRPMPEPIGSRPKDISIYGAIDMGGSISEMTSSLFYANEGKLRNPRYVTKGGSWRGIAQFTRVASRGMTLPNERSSEIGFRLVRDLPQPGLLG